MKITIITLFPQLFDTFFKTSILGRASIKNLVEYNLVDLRNFGEGKHQIVDGRPFGGGAGMILRADILAKAINSAVKDFPSKPFTILLSATGTTFKQNIAQKLSTIENLILVCGHYEGVDQRFIDHYIDEEISIGDYVLTGGEVPAMVITDAIVRLIPGVLKKAEAVINESFSDNTLEHPHYTRPATFELEDVPEVLTSGNHLEIEKWRQEKSREKTLKKRPDLAKST